jgi:hypothetical protein
MCQIHIASLPCSLVSSGWRLVEFPWVSCLTCQIVAFPPYISVHSHKSQYSVFFNSYIKALLSSLWVFSWVFLSSSVFLLLLEKIVHMLNRSECTVPVNVAVDLWFMIWPFETSLNQHSVCFHIPCSWWLSFSLKLRFCFLLLLWETLGVDAYTLILIHIQLEKLWWCSVDMYLDTIQHQYPATMLWMNILLHLKITRIIIALSRLLSLALCC